jgi:hypothetical protein
MYAMRRERYRCGVDIVLHLGQEGKLERTQPCHANVV